MNNRKTLEMNIPNLMTIFFEAKKKNQPFGVSYFYLVPFIVLNKDLCLSCALRLVI